MSYSKRSLAISYSYSSFRCFMSASYSAMVSSTCTYSMTVSSSFDKSSLLTSPPYLIYSMTPF